MKITNEILGNAIGGIISAVVIGVFLWMYKRYRAFMKDYRRKKQELESMNDEMFKLGATKQEFERMQAELKSKSEALRLAEAQEQAAGHHTAEL